MADQACVIHPLIVQGRADPQDRNLDTGCVALHEAARRGHIDCVKVIEHFLGRANILIIDPKLQRVVWEPWSRVLYPAGFRAGGWAGGCQTCGTHISVTAWRIFSVRSSMELSRPVVVHCHAHTPICPIWACPWAKNLSNLPQIGSRLCGSHISETAGWIYPI